MESGELTRKRALAATLYAARQNPVDADMVTRNNRLKAAAQAFVAPYNQANYMNAPCCPPIRTGGAASDYGDSRLDEASFTGTTVNTFTNVMDRRAGAAICCGPPLATTLPQGVQLYGDCSCAARIPSAPIITSVTPGIASLTVYFTAPTDDGGSPITSYRYLVDGALSPNVLTNTDPFIITGLTNDVTYTIIVYAINGNGPGPNSNPATGTPTMDPMIMTITTTTINTVMSLPFGGLGTGGVTVDWGDGSKLKYTSTPIQKTYVSVGNYTIRITGSTTSYGNSAGYTGADKIITVIQWGGLNLTSLAGAFYNATNLISLPSTLPLNIGDTSYMLYGATAYNKNISSWDVSKVQNMSSMFSGASIFNNSGQPLNWGSKTGLVDNMSGMFQNATTFNQDISGWDVSKVQNMESMFNTASSFNNSGQPLNWGSKTGLVNNMKSMFENATAFNRDVSGWDVSKVQDMESMFGNALSFNNNGQPFNWGSKTSLVNNMRFMFNNARSFNQDISGWDVSKVTNMGGMFENARVFNNGGQPLNWGAKTGLVNYTGFMFSSARVFNQDISSWDVSKVTNMLYMFQDARAFNNGGQPLTWGAKIASVTNMEFMFAFAYAFNQDISGWDVSKVETMYKMFWSATSFNNGGQPLNWGSKTGLVNNMSEMFNGAFVFDQDISGWNTNKVTDMFKMFGTALAFNNAGQPLNWGAKTSLVNNMGYMFYNAPAFNQDISGWNVSKVRDMSSMFERATAFNNGGQPLTWGAMTSEVTDMTSMFNGATIFNQNISGWNVAKVILMTSMFSGASVFNQNLFPWTATALTTATNIFCNCPMLLEPTSKWPPKLLTFSPPQNFGC